MRHWNYRYLALALFLPVFAFSIYKTFQAEVVPIKEYQRAKVEFANIIPPEGDRLENQSSSYQTYRAFSRYEYKSVQSKEWVSSFFTHQLDSAGWLTNLSGKDGRFFCRNGLRVDLSYSATRETRYSLGFTLGDQPSERDKGCEGAR